MCLHLAVIIWKMTCHLHFITETWGRASELQLRPGDVCSVRRRSGSEEPRHLQRGHDECVAPGGDASDGGEWHFMDRFSHLLVSSICWAFLWRFPDKWKDLFKDALVLKQTALHLFPPELGQITQNLSPTLCDVLIPSTKKNIHLVKLKLYWIDANIIILKYALWYIVLFDKVVSLFQRL